MNKHKQHETNFGTTWNNIAATTTAHISCTLWPNGDGASLKQNHYLMCFCQLNLNTPQPKKHMPSVTRRSDLFCSLLGGWRMFMWGSSTKDFCSFAMHSDVCLQCTWLFIASTALLRNGATACLCWNLMYERLPPLILCLHAVICRLAVGWTCSPSTTNSRRISNNTISCNFPHSLRGFGPT